MSGNALHDSLLEELQRGGLIPEETPAAPPDSPAPLDLGYAEKLAADVESLLQNLPAGEPPGEDAQTIDVQSILAQRLGQVKTAMAPSPDAEQGRERLLQKLAQVVPGMAAVKPSAADRHVQVKGILESWKVALREKGGGA